MVWPEIAIDRIKGQGKRGPAKWDARGMSVDRRNRLLAFGVLLTTALVLAACSSSIADLPLVGTPADAPARPNEAAAYLPVHDLPPDRDQAVIPPKERARIEAELIAARERQASTANSQNAAAK
jgi:hypothetical protein